MNDETKEAIKAALKSWRLGLLKIYFKSIGLALVGSVVTLFLSVALQIQNTNFNAILGLTTGMFIYLGYSLPNIKLISKIYEDIIKAILEESHED